MLRSIALVVSLVSACGARGVNPGEDPRAVTPPPPREQRSRLEELPHSSENRLRYWQYGCPDNAAVRNLEVIQLGDTPKERRRQGKVARWEVVCGDRILRCTQRHILRCEWSR